MKTAFMSVLVVLGALAATDALAQGPGYMVQSDREFRSPRAARSEAQRPADRDAPSARAQRRAVASDAFDGAWSVAINTRSGACEPSYRFGVRIINGSVVYEGRASGRVSPNGAVQVSISQGGQHAAGQGRLSQSHGGGSWRGYGSGGACAGTWQAVRRD